MLKKVKKYERRCSKCTRHNINCFEHRSNKHATECNKYSETYQEPMKCLYCNGTGSNPLYLLQDFEPKMCPSCKGSGIRRIVTINGIDGFI